MTGIDTDRLKEEKERGITIELGFASLDLPSGQHLGIVDVPGHEKFVKNMVAGATGIDIVIMVIAADEGINNSCMVISQEMIERKMGNHGSKSIIFNKKNVIVKEERVKGSWHKVYTCELRCTLMGFERNYQVGILFNQINKQRMYTSIVTPSDIKLTMDPWFVTGFMDGEGCFIVSIIKDNKYKLSWRVICRFEISLNNKDLDLLKKIKSYFGVGNIYIFYWKS